MVAACNRSDLIGQAADVLYNNYRICELHFEDSYFSKTRKRLLMNAVPTIFRNLKQKLETDATAFECNTVNTNAVVPFTSASTFGTCVSKRIVEVDVNTSDSEIQANTNDRNVHTSSRS